MGDGSHCIADPKYKDEFEAKHASGVHILIPEYDDSEHWYVCAYPGCGHEEGREKHVPSYHWKALEGGWGNKKGTEKCGCKVCAYDSVLTREVEGKMAYFESSPASVCMENGKTYKYHFRLVVIGPNGKKATWNGGSVQAFELPKGKTWPSDPAEVFNASFTEWPREAVSSSGSVIGEVNGKKNGLPRTNCVREFRLIFSNGLQGDDAYYCYSEPFKVTWAENHMHVYNCKHGTWKTCPLPEYITIYGLDPDGNCHWFECECGQFWGVEKCTAIHTGSTGNCQQPGHSDYLCPKCGWKWTEKNLVPGPHQPTGVLKDDDHRDAEKHYDICALCGTKLAAYDHDFVVMSSFKTCTTETRYLRCDDCGYAKIDKKQLSKPNHDYASPIYADGVYHTCTCKKCGHVLKEKHAYKTEYHGRCRCGAEPNSGLEVSLKGTFCPHGHAEIVFGPGVDSSLYEVGWGIGGHTYGPSTRWDFSDNDANAGYLIKIYAYELNGALVAPRTDGSNRIQVWEMPLIVMGYMDIPGYPADCVNDGVMAHRMCLGCGKMIDGKGKTLTNVSIPATGHTYDSDCDPSCNVCGAMRDAHHEWGTAWYSDGTGHWNKCTRCGADGYRHSHSLTGVTVTVPASCESDGQYKGTCGVCGFQTTGILPATGHDLKYVERKPTCVSDGWKRHYGCEACGLCYTDETCSTQVSANEYRLPIDPDNHVGGELHHDAGSHWEKCRCGKDIKKESHRFGDDGVCTVCGYKKTGPDGKGIGKWLPFAIMLLLLLLIILLIFLLTRRKKKEDGAPDPGEGGEAPPDPAAPADDAGGGEGRADDPGAPEA
jgi:hypothetical protein